MGQNVELSPIVVTGSRPSGGVNHALADDSLPIVIDNAPYTDMGGSAYFDPAASGNADFSQNAGSTPPTENVPQPHPEETAKSLAGDIASQINTATDLLAKPLEERAQILQRTAELKSELAATYANGMITFQNGQMPADAADFYARNPGALAETVEAMRQEAKEIHKIGGENAGKAYLMGVAGKLAGGASNGLDILELGGRLNKAYHEDTQSNWDSVYGQFAKIMVGAAGGAAALGTARALGVML
ncbi:hypothetical protein [Neisseria yangbaofengii]|nr:hypothetical protein [Neisseria yangbaofengii]